jgi:hypothetical protein
VCKLNLHTILKPTKAYCFPTMLGQKASSLNPPGDQAVGRRPGITILPTLYSVPGTPEQLPYDRMSPAQHLFLQSQEGLQWYNAQVRFSKNLAEPSFLGFMNKHPRVSWHQMKLRWCGAISMPTFPGLHSKLTGVTHPHIHTLLLKSQTNILTHTPFQLSLSRLTPSR